MQPTFVQRTIAVLVGTILSICSPAVLSKGEAAPTGVGINVDVSKIITQVGDWVKLGFNTWQESKREAAREAVPKLVVSYISLASTLNQISHTLERIKNDTNESRYIDRLLSAQLAELDTHMSNIRDHSEDIDPLWVSKNFELAAHQAKNRLTRNLEVEETIDRFGNRALARQLSATQLQETADKLRRTANRALEMAKSLARTVGE